MSNFIKHFGYACAVTLLLIGGCHKSSSVGSSDVVYTVDEVFERGPLAVHVRLDQAELNIAQKLQLQLEATTDSNYDVTLPKVDKILTQFGILDWYRHPDRLDTEQRLIRTQDYELEPFLSGDYEIPALTFIFYDVNDPNNTHELTTEPIAVKVTSLLGDDRNDLTIADIEDVVDVPRPPINWKLWIGLIIALWTVVIGLVVAMRRQRGPMAEMRVYKPAHEVAYARLQALIAEDLVAAGYVKEFYQRINAILRHYIEDRFNLRAPERTTEEFLIELRQTDHLNDEHKNHLGEFLEHCDLVKFAKHQPAEAEIQRTFDLVKQFIEATRSDEDQVDVTDHIVTTPPPSTEGQD